MSEPIMLRFLTAGWNTQLQDGGRPGYQEYGVPAGGFMDQNSARLANRLVGNPDRNALLEIALLGPQIEISGPCQLAITGGVCQPRLNDQRIPMWKTIPVPASGRLSIGQIAQGCRCYLAIGGQWRAPSWLGSQSRAVTATERWTPGAEIAAGDVHWMEPKVSAPIRHVPPRHWTSLSSHPTVQITPGPEWHLFSKDAQHALVEQTWTLSTDCDRMGLRLEETLPGSTQAAQILSSGVVPGVIQIPASGMPIVLLRDAQTTGGYPRMAVVDDRELDRLGQCRPGDQLSFRWSNS